MSEEPTDPRQVARLKNYLMKYDEPTLLRMYRDLDKMNSSSGNISKARREMALAYLDALQEKRDQREILEARQRGQEEEAIQRIREREELQERIWRRGEEALQKWKQRESGRLLSGAAGESGEHNTIS